MARDRTPISAAPLRRLAGRQGARKGGAQPGARDAGRRTYRVRRSASRACIPTGGDDLSSSSGSPLQAKNNFDITDLFETLAAAGVGPSMANPARPLELGPLRGLLPSVVSAAPRAELDARRVHHDADVDALLVGPQERLDRWRSTRFSHATLFDEANRRKSESRTQEVADDTTALIDSMRTTGQPLVRVLAVLVPRAAVNTGAVA